MRVLDMDEDYPEAQASTALVYRGESTILVPPLKSASNPPKFVFTSLGFDCFLYPIKIGYSLNQPIQFDLPSKFSDPTETLAEINYDEDAGCPTIKGISDLKLTSFKIEGKKCKLRKGQLVLFGPFYGFTVSHCINKEGSEVEKEEGVPNSDWINIESIDPEEEEEDDSEKPPYLEIKWRSFTEIKFPFDMHETKLSSEKQEVIIGRRKNPSVQIYIPSAEVKDIHAKIAYDQQFGWYIEDLPSENQPEKQKYQGTFLSLKTAPQIANKEDSKRFKLNPDILVNIGDYVFGVQKGKAFPLHNFLQYDLNQTGDRIKYKFIPDSEQALKNPFPLTIGAHEDNLIQIIATQKSLVGKVQCKIFKSNDELGIMCCSKKFPTLVRIPEGKAYQLNKGAMILIGNTYGFHVTNCSKADPPSLKIKYMQFIPHMSRLSFDGEEDEIDKSKKFKLARSVPKGEGRGFLVSDISRDHALIEYQNILGWIIKDIKSTNGTFVALKTYTEYKSRGNSHSGKFILEPGMEIIIDRQKFKVAGEPSKSPVLKLEPFENDS